MKDVSTFWANDDEWARGSTNCDIVAELVSLLKFMPFPVAQEWFDLIADADFSPNLSA